MCNKVTEELSEIFEKLEKRVILKQRRRLNVVFTSSELKPVPFLPELSHFDFEHNSCKQIIKIRLLRLSKF